MKQIIITGFLILFFSISFSQVNNTQKESIKYFNSFQKFVYETPDLDSAFYYVQKLALDKKNAHWLRDLVHNSFAQEFIENKSETADSNKNSHRLFCKKLLLKMRFSKSDLLKETILPLYLFVKIQDSKNDQSKLIELTNEYISGELLEKDTYENRAARYGLMIYKIISKQTALIPFANKLFSIIESQLENNQIKSTIFSSREELYKRAWYRYLYASINFIKADETDNIKEKGNYLKKSFQYSPDLIDEIHKNDYFYDMYFLFGEEKDFKVEYLTFLKNQKVKKNEILSVLLQMALTNPEYKEELKTYYTNNFSGNNFANYWMKAINNIAIDAPAISLKMLDKKLFSSSKLKGKWILVDFWGTWCMPCRKEHPDLQKFYQSFVLQNSKNISLLTIACKDNYNRVVKYMKKNNFSFPVAMSNNKIKEYYSVTEYPTKVLITPDGKFIKIPHVIDWESFVREYCNLN